MQTTFTGSGNEGLQIGLNPGTVNVNFAGATEMGRLSFLFHEICLSLILICQPMTDKDNNCLADFLLTDPRDEKIRIERTKGGLLIDSFRWILDNSEFQSWREGTDSQLLWIKGDAGKGKTMLMIGIIDELKQG